MKPNPDCKTHRYFSVERLQSKRSTEKYLWVLQYLRHFSKTPDFVCAKRTQNQGFWKNGRYSVLQFGFSMKPSCWHGLKLSALLVPGLLLNLGMATIGVALPPPEDIPEEVLRTEIIVQGRSPVTGELLTAEKFAEEQAAIAATLDQSGEIISPQIRQFLLLLRIRDLVRPVLPIVR